MGLSKFSDEIIDSMSIDCVIFGFKNSRLYILLVKHGEGIRIGHWALPGGWIRYNESVITVAYYALVNPEDFEIHPGTTVSDAQWFNIHEVPSMVYDHNKILDWGFKHLRHKVQHEPIGFNLLPKKFTLHQLQELYEAILEKKLDKPNFRRKLMNMELLVPCNEKQKDVSHRAARLYRFDKKVYNRLIEKGFTFEV